MKNSLATLILLFLSVFAFAQDSIPVTFRQESDTLVKQRFIDRYENVFMTKVPTRQMFKAGILASNVQGLGMNFGYEYKILPSLSVEGSIYAQLSTDNIGLAYNLQHQTLKAVNIWANAKVRWYHNMNKRISKGLTANNFSGTYVGFSFEQSIHSGIYSGGENPSRLGLLYGFQSRFFNNGYVDFSLGLYQKEIPRRYGFFEYQDSFDVRNFILGTQGTIGIALGDWKRSPTSPVCDVIICDESIQSQFKIEMPDISIGLTSQNVRAGLAYEVKIGNTPLSVQANSAVSLYNLSGRDRPQQTYTLFGAGLELRYYFLQKLMIRLGKGGNNLSGLYTALRGSYEIFTIKATQPYQPELDMYETMRRPGAALAVGYQQRLFKRLYIDASVFYTKALQSGYYMPGVSKPFLSSKMAIGFTF